jgi:DNA-directed RNA polymerase beta' subunit
MESGRSTVVGDPQLPIDEIIIPHSLAYQMIDLQIIEGLAKKGFLKDAKNKYRKCDEDAIAVMHEIIEHSCATLVRNPSLHKFNMMSFKIRLTEDDVAIHVPILICPSYAMDFDGDQSFVQIHTDPMRVASFESMRPQNNWFYEKRNKGPVYVPQHEVLFGLYMASRITRGETIKGFETLADARKAYDDNKITVSEVVIIDDVTTTFGRAIISDIIGSQLNNITGIDKPIDTDKIVEVMRFLEGKENRVEALRKLQIFGSTIATNIGLESLPFKNIYGQNNKEIDAIANSNEPVGVRVNKLKDFFEDTMKKKISADPDSNLSHLIKGSGRVKYSQLV